MDEETAVAWIDILNLMLMGLVMAVAFALMLMNPPKKDTAVKDPIVKGSITFQLFWPAEMDTDVDMWIMAPGKDIIGYSNKNGKNIDLLRDDLGFFNDVSGTNFELATARTIIPGEYVVNAHWFSRRDTKLDKVPIHLSVYVRANGEYLLIAEVKTELVHVGQELTLLRFKLDNTGHLVPGSVNNLPMELRSAAQ